LLIRSIHNLYPFKAVDHKNKVFNPIENMDDMLSNYETSMNKNASQFDCFYLECLNCVIMEHWDYTYIIYYKDEKCIESLSPIIYQNGLFHFKG